MTLTAWFWIAVSVVLPIMALVVIAQSAHAGIRQWWRGRPDWWLGSPAEYREWQAKLASAERAQREREHAMEVRVTFALGFGLGLLLGLVLGTGGMGTDVF
jgi:uncharacterized membrane protein YfcA